MIRQILCTIAAACALGVPSASAEDMPLETGRWYAFFATPGGRLPFQLDVAGEPGAYTVHVINGAERVPIPIVEIEGDQLLLEFDHYDSRIQAGIYDDGASLHGVWTKERGTKDPPVLKFWAYRNDQPRFNLPRAQGALDAAKMMLDGIWRVRFEGSEMDAVGEFEVDEKGRATGTFRTPTGDYRFLEGALNGGRLELSCFDGAHVFFFRANLGSTPVANEEGEEELVRSFSGMFYSGDWWQESWTAIKDALAELPNPERSVNVDRMIDLTAFSRPDVDGTPRTLDELTDGARCIIVEIMGSWCPNCHDASMYLMELHDAHASEGLRIVSLSFEVTGDSERDRQQIRTYIDRLGMTYPILYAGQSDKADAAASLPFLDQIIAYPTFLILNEHGGVVMSYSGFDGPATGKAHDEMRDRIERTIRNILAIN